MDLKWTRIRHHSLKEDDGIESIYVTEDIARWGCSVRLGIIKFMGEWQFIFLEGGLSYEELGNLFEANPPQLIECELLSDTQTVVHQDGVFSTLKEAKSAVQKWRSHELFTQMDFIMSSLTVIDANRYLELELKRSFPNATNSESVKVEKKQIESKSSGLLNIVKEDQRIESLEMTDSVNLSGLGNAMSFGDIQVGTEQPSGCGCTPATVFLVVFVVIFFIAILS
jgi:hypothetical protein